MNKNRTRMTRMQADENWNADFADASSADKNGLKISVNPRCKSGFIRVPKKNQRKSAFENPLNPRSKKKSALIRV